MYRIRPLTGQSGGLATMLLCIGLTLALSRLVYRLVERPMIRFGRSLSSIGDAPAGYSIALKRFR